MNSDQGHFNISSFPTLQGRGALQDIDQMSLFKPLCKFCVSIGCVRDIIPTIRKAIAIAQSDTPGKYVMGSAKISHKGDN